MSEFSDLTDFDDDEDVPLSSQKSAKSKAKGKGSANPTGYKIRGALRPPRATTYTCQALYGAHLRPRKPHILFMMLLVKTRFMRKT